MYMVENSVKMTVDNIWQGKNKCGQPKNISAKIFVLCHVIHN